MENKCYSCRHYDPTVEEDNCTIHNAFLALVRLTGVLMIIDQCPQYQSEDAIPIDINAVVW